MVGIVQEDEKPRKRKFGSQVVSFADEEEVINPGDRLCVWGGGGEEVGDEVVTSMLYLCTVSKSRGCGSLHREISKYGSNYCDSRKG